MEMVRLALRWGQRVSHQDIRPQVAATVKGLQVEVTGVTMEFLALHTAQHLPNTLLHHQLIARPLLRTPRHHLSTLQHRRLTAQLHQPTVPRHQRTVLLLLPTVQRLRHTVQHHQHTVQRRRSTPRRLQRTALRLQRTAQHHQTTPRLRRLTVLPHQRTVPPHLSIHRPHLPIAPLRRHTVQRLHSIVQQALHTAPRARHIHRLVRLTAQAQEKTETRINCVNELLTTSFDDSVDVLQDSLHLFACKQASSMR